VLSCQAGPILYCHDHEGVIMYTFSGCGLDSSHKVSSRMICTLCAHGTHWCDIAAYWSPLDWLIALFCLLRQNGVRYSQTNCCFTCILVLWSFQSKSLEFVCLIYQELRLHLEVCNLLDCMTGHKWKQFYCVKMSDGHTGR